MFRTLIVAVAVAMLLAPAVSMAAQQDGHTMPGIPQAGQAAGSPLVAACVASQQQVTVAADAANRRIEFARQTNQPAAMRAAIDDLQGVLSSMRAQLAPCAGLQSLAAADPQAGHVMPGAAQTPAMAPGTPVVRPGSTGPAPAAGAPAAPMDHSKMPMAGKASAGNPAAAVGAKPAPAAPMDHSKMPMGGAAANNAPAGTPVPLAIDPVCGLKVEPSTAPRATYQEQTHYFCSDQHRQLFQKDAAKYVPKDKR